MATMAAPRKVDRQADDLRNALAGITTRPVEVAVCDRVQDAPPGTLVDFPSHPNCLVAEQAALIELMKYLGLSSAHAIAATEHVWKIAHLFGMCVCVENYGSDSAVVKLTLIPA